MQLVTQPILWFFIFLLSHAALADEPRIEITLSTQSPELIDYNSNFKVLVINEVDGDCWETSYDSASIVAYELNMSGYREVFEPDILNRFNVTLKGIGLDAGETGVCVIYATLEMFDSAVTVRNHNPFYFYGGIDRPTFRYETLLSGDRETVSSRLFNWYKETTRQFIVDVDRARRSFLREIRFRNPHITEDQLQEIRTLVTGPIPN